MTNTAHLYLDDLKPGMRFTTQSLKVSTEQIKEFADQFDPQPFHLDESAAEKSLFRGLAASGWHTASLTMRLMVTSGIPLAQGMIGAGVEVNWPNPTRPGDELQVVMEIQEVIPSRSKPDRGIVVVRNETLNQHGEAVQVMTAKLLVFRRPA
ncbi:MaoC family dehydratase [Marinobacterium sediminicola]|uniref:Acyl dehydratase n=1 Tax=Marinobacterium sediminicola TaxID=518898 RepID=A0ABY1RW97_9GAMM|nr:MaoC family dehydratase [Marinobacterium sediminicola]ULG70412.1 MaoC family dehydratase [Marinobacterium sediminicola]SMR69428.1 Acyl dehydratase [Marinobacterium sediminicola]